MRSGLGFSRPSSPSMHGGQLPSTWRWRYSLGFPGLQPVLQGPWGLVHPVRREIKPQAGSETRLGLPGICLLGPWWGCFGVPAPSASLLGCGLLKSHHHSPLLLGLPVCQWGQTVQESQGARGLRGLPGHPSHHDHPVRRQFELRKECSRRGEEEKVLEDLRPDSAPSPATPG